MERKSARIKIKQSATVRRLRFLIGVALAAALLCFLTGSLFAALWKSAWGIVFAVGLLFLFCRAPVLGRTLCDRTCQNDEGGGQVCVRRDKYRLLRVFRTLSRHERHLFRRNGSVARGAQSVSVRRAGRGGVANVPLEVAYVKTAGERAEKKRAGNRKRKPDVQADAKIVVIGAAPLSKDCRFEK